MFYFVSKHCIFFWRNIRMVTIFIKKSVGINSCKSMSSWILSFVLILSAGECVPIYLPAKAVDAGLTRKQGALIMSIFGAIILPSQIIVGIVADLFHIRTSYLLMSSLIGMAVSSLVFTFCQSFSLFVVCVSVFSICQGEYFEAN